MLEAGPGPGGLVGDAKSQLNQFCQKYTKKAISKADYQYETMNFGSQYQTTLTIHCLDGVQFAGEVAPTAKQAEQNAAQIALDHYASEIAGLKASKNKSKSKSAGAGAAPAQPGANPSLNNRCYLNSALMKILKRAITKDDVAKNTVKTALGHQCTISIPNLPGEWASLAWAGEAKPNAKEAEESAATFAVEALQADPEMAALLAAPPTSNKKGSAKTVAEAVQIVTAIAGQKRTADAAFGGGGFAGDFGGGAANPCMNNRVLLNTSLMKILRRPVAKDDVQKNNVKTQLGYQCTITIPALPAEWAGLAWAGVAAPNAKEAEESAATYALEALQADPTFAQLLSAPKATPNKKGKFSQKKPQPAVSKTEWYQWQQWQAAGAAAAGGLR